LTITSSFHASCHTRLLSPFPTRRSSDLGLLAPRVEWDRKRHAAARRTVMATAAGTATARHPKGPPAPAPGPSAGRFLTTLLDSSDRKSTRLNSSHRTNSYAVFCLKKKNT